MQLSVGLVTLVLGLALLVASRVERAVVPRWMPRLGAGVMALGASTLAMHRGGQAWAVASIALSAVAIGLLLSVIVENLRRGKRRRRPHTPPTDP